MSPGRGLHQPWVVLVIKVLPRRNTPQEKEEEKKRKKKKMERDTQAV